MAYISNANQIDKCSVARRTPAHTHRQRIGWLACIASWYVALLRLAFMIPLNFMNSAHAAIWIILWMHGHTSIHTAKKRRCKCYRNQSTGLHSSNVFGFQTESTCSMCSVQILSMCCFNQLLHRFNKRKSCCWHKCNRMILRLFSFSPPHPLIDSKTKHQFRAYQPRTQRNVEPSHSG